MSSPANTCTAAEHRRYAPVTCLSATALILRSVAEKHVGSAIVELNRFAVDVQYTRRDSPSQSRGPSTFRRVHLGAQAARGCFVGRHALRPAWTRVRSWRSVPAQSYPCLVPPPPARPVLAVGPPPPHCKAALGRKSIGARRVPMRPPTPGFRSPARRIAKPSPIESP